MASVRKSQIGKSQGGKLPGKAACGQIAFAELPFHDSPPLDPAGPLDCADAARAMAEAIMAYAPATDTDVLKLLRASFPDSPLGLRVAALAVISRRRPRLLGNRDAG